MEIVVAEKAPRYLFGHALQREISIARTGPLAAELPIFHGVMAAALKVIIHTNDDRQYYADYHNNIYQETPT
jgi:hypothetical protein